VTYRQHLAQNSVDALLRAGRVPLLLLALAGMAGCHHKAPRFTIPVAGQVPLEVEEPSDEVPVIASTPEPEPLPLPPTPPTARQPPRRRPPAAPKDDAQTPVQIADAQTVDLAIGALSLGSDSTPQSLQQAQDLISSIVKRIAALPASLLEGQKETIRQVRHFLDESQKALKSGDAEGARLLATKARVLMDDLEKK